MVVRRAVDFGALSDRSERAMTATPAELPAALLAELRRDLLAIPGVAGLALDLTSKPPGTIEWE